MNEFNKEVKMCEPVQAFRSKNGELYLSKEECSRHDQIFEDKKVKDKIQEIFKHFIRSYSVNYSNNRYFDFQNIVCYDAQAAEDLTQLTNNWRLLRDKLNEMPL